MSLLDQSSITMTSSLTNSVEKPAGRSRNAPVSKSLMINQPSALLSPVGGSGEQSQACSPRPAGNDVEFDIPKGYTKKEKRQCFYLAQLSELKDVPPFLIRELARQEDVE